MLFKQFNVCKQFVYSFYASYPKLSKTYEVKVLGHAQGELHVLQAE